MEILAFALVLALAFANGTNDVSKAIATLVGSGVTDYRTALAWGTLWTILGAGLSGLVASAMVKTFSQGLIEAGTVLPSAVGLSVLVGTIAWVLIASWTGLPISTTHALIGGIVGAGCIALGSQALIWPSLFKKIALPLLLSPLLALAVSLAIHPLIRVLATRWDGACLCLMPASRALVTIDARGGTRTLFQAASLGMPVAAVPDQCDRAGLRGVTVGMDSIHWLSSGLTSLARGTNDAPKIAAMLLLGSAASWPSGQLQIAAFAGVALAMGLGSSWGGRRVTEVLAEKVTRMDHAEGLSANLTTSSLVFVQVLVSERNKNLMSRPRHPSPRSYA
ncbi:MAG: inorganic phosphate transporter [Nitrospirae bacterium]|nr:inorganic phosphate transporter [Nitrospirota bacterium]